MWSSQALPSRIMPPSHVHQSSEPDEVVCPARRTRTSKPKVRTGCTTCKIRRVKCDETKPACKRCTSTGRKCDGYEFPVKPTVRRSKSSDSSPPHPSGVTFPQVFQPASISKPFQGTVQERRSFHRFQYCTIPAFAGGSETGFWTKLVLKVGQEEPVVRNAIIALGTLHEDYQDRCGKYTVELIEEPSYRHALKLYGSSLRELNQRLNHPSRTNAKLAIIASILFTCFEILRRNNMAAVIHYQQGMRELIRQMNLPEGDDASLAPYSIQEYRTSRANFRDIPQDELDELLRVFARYDIQACTFSKPKAEPLNYPTTTLPRVSPTDLTLSQVRIHLDNLLVSVYQLVKSDLGMFRYWDAESVPLEWRFQTEHSVEVFDAWLSVLEDFFQLNEKNLGLAELKSLLGLRLQIRTAVIMLKVSIDCAAESTFDRFKDDFEDMVSRVEKMTSTFQMVDVRPLELERTPFTMELGIIHPLFFVACKSRDWTLRRRAISQLKKAGKEGVWEGPIMAVLAQRIATLEEQGVAEGDFIPEGNRFHEVRKNVNYDTRHVLWEGTKALDLTGKSFTVHREALPF